MPGIVKALTEARREHVAGSLEKRRRPVSTHVGRYVENRHPLLKRKLHAVFLKQTVRVAAMVRHAFAEKLAKVEGDMSEEDRKALIASILAQLDSEDLGVDLTDVLDGPMQDAFKRAAAMGLTQAGFDGVDRSIVEQVDVRAVAYARERSAELIQDLAQTTIDDLREVIANGVDEGMSASDLADAIDEMGGFGEARAETIARTELAKAHVEGNVEGWRATGEVDGKESILGDLHAIDDVCDDCADAGVVGLEDDFVDGYDLPPYHPNCICDVKPVLIDDSDS